MSAGSSLSDSSSSLSSSFDYESSSVSSSLAEEYQLDSSSSFSFSSSSSSSSSASSPPPPSSSSSSSPSSSSSFSSSSTSEQPLDLRFPPLFPHLERFAIYETKNIFYVVGDEGRFPSGSELLRFKVLKIARQTFDLVCDCDDREYDEEQLKSLLQVVDAKLMYQNMSGIVGFVRFTRGYYIYLILSSSVVAELGKHKIHTVEQSKLVYLPSPSFTSSSFPEGSLLASSRYESRYQQIFLLMDLSKNFYFSYTYPLTQMLQTNMIQWRKAKERPTRSIFLWNHHLLSDFSSLYESLTGDWTLQLMHGFLEQINCSISGRVFSVTLISRRSRFFAGTRYLKRGLNEGGDTANEVETEQIVGDKSIETRHESNYCSHVQMRGSIPVHWSQESSITTAQPDILLMKVDPLHCSTRKHVEQLFERYGTPLLLLNLVKQRERRKRESIVGAAFHEAIAFLNSSLPAPLKIEYLAWDFKSISKTKDESVVDELSIISHWSLHKTGFFHSCPHPEAVQDYALRRQGKHPLYQQILPTRESLKHLVPDLPEKKSSLPFSPASLAVSLAASATSSSPSSRSSSFSASPSSSFSSPSAALSSLSPPPILPPTAFSPSSPSSSSSSSSSSFSIAPTLPVSYSSVMFSSFSPASSPRRPSYIAPVASSPYLYSSAYQPPPSPSPSSSSPLSSSPSSFSFSSPPSRRTSSAFSSSPDFSSSSSLASPSHSVALQTASFSSALPSSPSSPLASPSPVVAFSSPPSASSPSSSSTTSSASSSSPSSSSSSSSSSSPFSCEPRSLGFLQRGICRSNCIDSLDRTNVAAFCMGRCALGYQLHSLGFIGGQSTESHSEVNNVLLGLYERMGDVLALQYGGSQMHRQMKKDQNKTQSLAPVLFTQQPQPTKPKEILVSLMRHYQNSVNDNAKQDAINLFLGLFTVNRDATKAALLPEMWEMASDYYLHNPTLCGIEEELREEKEKENKTEKEDGEEGEANTQGTDAQGETQALSLVSFPSPSAPPITLSTFPRSLRVIPEDISRWFEKPLLKFEQSLLQGPEYAQEEREEPKEDAQGKEGHNSVLDLAYESPAVLSSLEEILSRPTSTAKEIQLSGLKEEKKATLSDRIRAGLRLRRNPFPLMSSEIEEENKWMENEDFGRSPDEASEESQQKEAAEQLLEAENNSRPFYAAHLPSPDDEFFFVPNSLVQEAQKACSAVYRQKELIKEHQIKLGMEKERGWSFEHEPFSPAPSPKVPKINLNALFPLKVSRSVAYAMDLSADPQQSKPPAACSAPSPLVSDLGDLFRYYQTYAHSNELNEELLKDSYLSSHYQSGRVQVPLRDNKDEYEKYLNLGSLIV